MNGKDRGIYLLIGEERYLKEGFLRQIKSDLFGKGPATQRGGGDLDFSQFDANECSVDEVIASAKTLPFSSRFRLIVVKNPQNFSAKDRESLLEFLRDPAPTSSIVLDVEGSLPADSFLKSLPDNIQIKRFERLKRDELKSWIWGQIKKRKIDIDQDAVSALEELIGDDLSTIANALEKISLYQQAKAGAVTTEDIEELCGATSTKSGFELINAIKRKDPDSALRILNTLTRQGSSQFQIIGLLVWHLGRILKSQALSEGKLKVWMDELLETESAMKTGKVEWKTAVELCVTKLARLGL